MLGHRRWQVANKIDVKTKKTKNATKSEHRGSVGRRNISSEPNDDRIECNQGSTKEMNEISVNF